MSLAYLCLNAHIGSNSYLKSYVGLDVGANEGFVVSPGIVGSDVVGYREGDARGAVDGTLVVGATVGLEDG
jgi:hypothetical protein